MGRKKKMKTKITTKNAERTKLKKVWKIILWIILTVIAIWMIYTIRNFIIISKLQKEVKNYVSSTNYYMKSKSVEKDGTTVVVDYYTKNNKQVVMLYRKAKGETTKMSIYNNGTRNDMFIETSNSKIAKLNSGAISVNITNYLEMEKSWQPFLLSSISIVRSAEVNGKKCYIISNFNSPNLLTEKGANNNNVYVDKNTGL